MTLTRKEIDEWLAECEARDGDKFPITDPEQVAIIVGLLDHDRG